MWLSSNLLPKAGTTLEAGHCLVLSITLSCLEGRFESWTEEVKKWLDFVELRGLLEVETGLHRCRFQNSCKNLSLDMTDLHVQKECCYDNIAAFLFIGNT